METYRPLRAALTRPGEIPGSACVSAAGVAGGGGAATGGRVDESRCRILHIVVVPLLIGSAVVPMVAGQNPVFGALAALCVTVLIVLATMPVRLTMLIVVLVPITSGLRRGLPVPGLRLSEILIAVGAVAVLGLPTQRRPRWVTLDWAVLAFALAGSVIPLLDSVFVSGQHLAPRDLQTAFGPLQFLLLYRVTADVLRSVQAQRMAQRALLLASVPVSLLAIAEEVGPAAVHETLIAMTGTTAFNTQGYTAVSRSASVFPMWLALAGYLMVVILLGLSLLLGRIADVLPRWGLIVVILLGVLAVVASLSLTVTAMIIVGGGYLGWKHGQLTKILLLLGAIGLITAAVFGSLITQRMQAQTQSGARTRTVGPSWLPQTLAYRAEVWKEQYSGVVIKYAATGYGTDYPPEVEWGHTESGYITLLLRGGILYLSTAGLLLYAVIRRIRRELRTGPPPSRRALLYAAQTLVLAQFPLNLTFPYLTNSGMPQALWIVFGLVGGQGLWTGRCLASGETAGPPLASGIRILAGSGTTGSDEPP